MTTPAELFGLALPGGTSVSHLRVYDSVGPDGLAGGSPHLHTACAEAYLVIGGQGLVQTLSGEGYGETPLTAGTIAWFAPGTVHRLVNLDGHLEIFVVMSNAGLPEAGDMVLAFEPELLDDELRYRAAADLPPDGATTDGSPDPAMRRRDLAVTGFRYWRDEVELRGADALRRFHRSAVDLVGESASGWGELLDGDPASDADTSRAQVADLVNGDEEVAVERLGRSRIRSTLLTPVTRRMGCCGTLGTVIH